MEMKYPSPLKKGDKIAITAPSDGANLAYLDRAILQLKEYGFEVIETPHVRTTNKLMSTDGKTRAEELMSVWQDVNVKHIIAARGGEFLIDMIPYLHAYRHQIRITNPIQYVQGFSDISLLNLYLTTQFNIATMQAENIGHFGMQQLDPALVQTLQILEGSFDPSTGFMQHSFEQYEGNWRKDEDFVGYELTTPVKYQLLGSEESNISVEGRLIGGTIEAIIQLIGTPYDNTKSFCEQWKEGMIWYLDNYMLQAPALYTALLQMKHAGWFNNVNCFLIGRSYGGETVDTFTAEDAMQKALGDLHVPIIYDVDIGHVSPQFTLINGALATFLFDNGKGTIKQQLK